MNVLVTGGAGFIGSHSVEALLEHGHEVTVLDNFATGSIDNLQAVRSWVHVVKGDVRDLRCLLNIFQGGAYDGVLHLAAVASVPDSVRLPVKSHDVNLTGSLNVLEASRRAGVGRVVLASSAAVYGCRPCVPSTESIAGRLVSPYAAQKMSMEGYANAYQASYGMESVCLRYFNVYGPRQDPASPYSGVISIFLKTLRDGGQPVVYGDGGQTRDFVFVSDVAQTNVLALTAPEAAGESINVGTGSETTILQLLQTLCDIVGAPCQYSLADRRAGDVYRSCPDIEKLRALLSFVPQHTLAEGLRRLVEYEEVLTCAES